MAINRFYTDTENEIRIVEEFCKNAGVESSMTEIFAKGGDGGKDLASKVISTIENKSSEFKPIYDEKLSIKEKLDIIADEIYRADGVVYTAEAEKALKEIEKTRLWQYTRNALQKLNIRFLTIRQSWGNRKDLKLL